MHRAGLVEGAIAAIRAGGAEQSLDDLAAAIGVSKPVLYDQFGGRHGLADAIAVVLAQIVERDVLDSLTKAGALDLNIAVHAGIEALVTLIDDEPELYTFLVRSVRTSDRGFLDNALVRVLHERTRVLLRGVAPDVGPDEIAVLTDGVYGFVFASVESWQATQRPARDRMVELLSRVIQEGIRAVAWR